MKMFLNRAVVAAVAISVAGCALLKPLGQDDAARRVARVTLSAYETTQQAILIYGRLPTCGVLAPRICKDSAVWTKIKVVEAAATQAIGEATPVLNGTRADAGQLVAAFEAIENVKGAIKDARAKLEGSAP